MANKDKKIIVDASELDMFAKHGVKTIQAGSKKIILKNKKNYPAYIKPKHPVRKNISDNEV